MNDIKDILNKMKFVPEELQDEVLKNIKKSIEKEINKTCNPIKLVLQKLEELGFGKDKDSEQDRRIIRIIVSCLDYDWFYMEPIYCESIEKEEKIREYTHKYKANERFNKFIEDEVKNSDSGDQIYWLIREVAQQSNARNIDVIIDSYWIYKDGANGETWLYTTQGLANEMIYWFKECFYARNESDVKTCYKILDKLEKSFPKKE